jgi:hypothetical protein
MRSVTERHRLEACETAVDESPPDVLMEAR